MDPYESIYRGRKSRPQGRELAQSFLWGGVALIATFLSGTLVRAFPLALMDPQWLQNVTDSMLSLGGAALIGTLFAALARVIDDQDEFLRKRVQTIQLLAFFAAFGWIALIGVQIYTGTTLIGKAKEAEVQQVNALKAVRSRLLNVTNEDQLREVISLLPNAPATFTLRSSVEKVKEQFQKDLDAEIAKTTELSKQSESFRWQTWLKQIIGQGIVALLLALGFAAVGKRPGRPTLLTAITSAINTNGIRKR